MIEKRLEWVDIARGFAIILVVMGHVVSSYHEAGLYETSDFMNFICKFVYSFHMALFILLSGFLYSRSDSRKSKKTSILQKLINYGIPYVLFSVLWVFMKLLFQEFTNTPVTLHDLLLIPFYPISFMWFIYALLIMEIFQVLIGNRSVKFKACHLILAGGGIWFNHT